MSWEVRQGDAHGRRFIGLELNAEYVTMARRRIAGPLFAQEATP